MPAHIYFSSHPFLGSGGRAQSPCVWLVALHACWALSMDGLSYGRHYHCPGAGIPVHEHACLFSLLSLWGLGHVCVAQPQFSVAAFASAGTQQLI
jgi:hypothetical protein